ncbi:hypothetical protein IWQ60_009194 [Tieghemiomyces parasiticus]|uniref:Plasma membrane proteolipid 3 n=1 Tax=Tieghemiomyces parasiticus TaxID=78921 RepID=A0A9W7ZYI1_9FUNG|nr:hypothetical protein IWQ60_009194 [Tieghemiomyces parasiticus]
MALNTTDVLLLLIGFLFPPLGALLKRGCGADFIINCALTILGYVPGVIHAWYLVIKYSGGDYQQLPTHVQPRCDGHQQHQREGGNVIVVHDPRGAQGPSSSSQQHDAPPSYGSIVKGDTKTKASDRKP